jgi:hypothetical protein
MYQLSRLMNNFIEYSDCQPIPKSLWYLIKRSTYDLKGPQRTKMMNTNIPMYGMAGCVI